MRRKLTMRLKLVEAADGRLIGMAVFRCALLMGYFLWMAIFQALGAYNAAIFRPSI